MKQTRSISVSAIDVLHWLAKKSDTDWHDRHAAATKLHITRRTSRRCLAILRHYGLLEDGPEPRFDRVRATAAGRAMIMHAEEHGTYLE
jgi:DNA-binding IscR family transcriptional regulator